MGEVKEDLDFVLYFYNKMLCMLVGRHFIRTEILLSMRLLGSLLPVC